MDFSRFLVYYLALLVAMVLHEAAHALAAHLGGDDTAYEAGQVTLNPIPHIRREPFGTILLPLLSFYMIGFPLGFAHAPYNPYWADRHPRRAALMSFAGPGANLLLAALIFGLLKIGLQVGWFDRPLPPETVWDLIEGLVAAPGWAEEGAAYALAKGCSILLTLNFILGIFNLIPIPPLDGAGIAEGLLPGPLGGFFRFLRRDPMFGLIGLIAAWYLGGELITESFHWMRALLLG